MKLDDAELKKLVGGLTFNTFDSWRIAGPNNAANRKMIMGAITGQSLPLAKCGVTALRDALLNRAGIVAAGKCGAELDKALKVWGTT